MMESVQALVVTGTRYVVIFSQRSAPIAAVLLVYLLCVRVSVQPAQLDKTVVEAALAWDEFYYRAIGSGGILPRASDLKNARITAVNDTWVPIIETEGDPQTGRIDGKRSEGGNCWANIGPRRYVTEYPSWGLRQKKGNEPDRPLFFYTKAFHPSVGERVVTLSLGSIMEHPIGTNGKLIEDDKTALPFNVKFEDGTSEWYREGQLGPYEVTVPSREDALAHWPWLAGSLSTESGFSVGFWLLPLLFLAFLYHMSLRSCSSTQSSSHPHELDASLDDTISNVRFYRCECSVPRIGTIKALHKWKGDYETLEIRHDYVQWMFPNFFASQFNGAAFPLSKGEAETFRQDIHIASHLLESYKLFLDFLGLSLVNWQTGDVERVPGGEHRLYAALVAHPHNQLRIRRILASLAVTGFRRYMKPLVAHLHWEITGNGWLSWMTEQFVAKPALRDLSRSDVLATWLQYVDDVPEHFLKNTRATMNECSESVLFSAKTHHLPSATLSQKPASTLHKQIVESTDLRPWSSTSQKASGVVTTSARTANDVICLWRGDITRLKIDGIVNAANEGLWAGGGICGAIHAAAGPGLQSECQKLGRCRTGHTVLTQAYNLPSKFVLHTVGPTDGKNEALLRSCYVSLLDLAAKHTLRSVALCCVSTGIFGFPLEPATRIALQTVRQWLDSHGNTTIRQVVFVVFTDSEEQIYKQLLHDYFPLVGDAVGTPKMAVDLSPSLDTTLQFHGAQVQSQQSASVQEQASLFLPKLIDGVVVLKVAAKSDCQWFADNSVLKRTTKGLAYRKSRSLNDKRDWILPWGSTVHGIDEGTWVRVEIKDAEPPLEGTWGFGPRSAQYMLVAHGRDYKVKQLLDNKNLTGTLSKVNEWYVGDIFDNNKVFGRLRLQAFEDAIRSNFRCAGEDDWRESQIARKARQSQLLLLPPSHPRPERSRVSCGKRKQR